MADEWGSFFELGALVHVAEGEKISGGKLVDGPMRRHGHRTVLQLSHMEEGTVVSITRIERLNGEHQVLSFEIDFPGHGFVLFNGHSKSFLRPPKGHSWWGQFASRN